MTTPSAYHPAHYASHLLGILRIVTAALFIAHGTAKLFGFPPGAAPGLQPLASLFGAAGVVEVVTGVLILLGFFTRPAALIASGEMAVAYWMVHAPHSFFPAVNGGDAAVLFCFVFLYLVAAGPGAFSLDAMLHRAPPLVRGSARA
jgi:putative oxidoreductase